MAPFGATHFKKSSPSFKLEARTHFIKSVKFFATESICPSWENCNAYSVLLVTTLSCLLPFQLNPSIAMSTKKTNKEFTGTI